MSDFLDSCGKQEKADDKEASASFFSFLNRVFGLVLFLLFVVHCDDLASFLSVHRFDWKLFLCIAFVALLLE